MVFSFMALQEFIFYWLVILEIQHWTCKAQRKSSYGEKFEAEWFLDLFEVQLVDVRCIEIFRYDGVTFLPFLGVQVLG